MYGRPLPRGQGLRDARRLSNVGALGIAAPRMEGDLAPGRTSAPLVVRTHPHVAFFGGAVGFTAFVALVVALLIRHNDLPAATNWHFVYYGLAVAVSGWIGPLLRWRAAWVDLDEQRLRWSVGLFRPRRLESQLDRLQAFVVEQSPAGRWLGYATLRAVDEQGAEHAFPAVGHVGAFRAVAARLLGGRRTRGGIRKSR